MASTGGSTDAVVPSASSSSAARITLNGSTPRAHAASPSQVNLNNLAAKRTPDTAGSHVIPEDNDALKSIANALSENGFTEQDIWDANPALSPLLTSLRPQLDSLRKSTTSVMLSIDFTQCEDFSKLGFTKKVYKVDSSKTAWQTVALIFTKVGPALAAAPATAGLATPSSPVIPHAHAVSAPGAPNYRRYCLKTPAGNVIDDNAPLSSFGLGSIFHSWELVMFRKTAEQFAASTTRPTSTSIVEGQAYVVSFLPGDGPMFSGISKLTKKVLADTPTGQLIANFCKRYNISEPERFVLTSTGDLVLSRNQSLGYYGLGKKFDTMTVKLVLRKDLDDPVPSGSSPSTSPAPGTSATGTGSGSSSPSTSSPLGGSGGRSGAAPQMSGFSAGSRPSSRTARHSVLISPEVAWTQLDDHLSVREAQAVILDLDKQLADSKHSLQTAMQQRSEEREALRKLVMKERESYKELETQHDQLRQQARTLVDVYVTAKERQDDLLVAKSSLEAEVTRLQGDITNMRALMGRARDELMTTRTESAQKTDQINMLQGEVLSQKVEREELKLGLELRITALGRELQDETEKVLALYSEQISLKDEIERQQTQLAKLKAERTESEANLAAASQREAQLASEVTQLKKEVSSAQYGEQQAKIAIEVGIEEIGELTAQVDTLTAEKRNAEQAAATLKASLSSTIDQQEAELKSAQSNLETLSREKSDLETHFETQLRIMQEAMSKASTSAGGAPITAAAFASTVELETLKAQKASLTDRLEASSADATNLKRQLAEAKSEAASLREANAVAEKAGIDALDGVKRQLASVKDQLSAEQKSASESKQAQHDLSQELSSTQSQYTTAAAKVAQLVDDLRNERADHEAKREAAEAAEREMFREMNGKLSKVASEKAEVEKQLKDSEQKVKDTTAEKLDAEKQLLDAQQTAKEQSTLISEQKAIIIRLETPPPAPFIAATLRIEARRAQKNGKAGAAGSLEDEILGIKDTLQKIDTSALSKKKDFNSENMLSNMLMSGLEKRFKAARSEDEVEDLASDDLYIPNDNEEEWR